MISGQTREASLATEALNAIDELRDEYGAPGSEPRHPDIESGRSWPMVGCTTGHGSGSDWNHREG